MEPMNADASTAATKGDVRDAVVLFRSELQEGMAAVRSELREGLTAVRGELQEGLTAVRGELQEGLTAVRGELQEGLTAVRGELASAVDRLAKRILESESNIQRTLEAHLAEAREMREKLLDAYADTTFKGKLYYEKAISQERTIIDHEFQLADHEKRLNTLEDVPPHRKEG
ncbi:MAG: hypothetical protein WC943_15385 [Elusimicrobiota bacterium]|jgi:hypothetical protein